MPHPPRDSSSRELLGEASQVIQQGRSFRPGALMALLSVYEVTLRHLDVQCQPMALTMRQLVQCFTSAPTGQVRSYPPRLASPRLRAATCTFLAAKDFNVKTGESMISRMSQGSDGLVILADVREVLFLELNVLIPGGALSLDGIININHLVNVRRLEMLE
ncbi:hypothetical protein LA080_011365 [Diaporthe eres]|nr:hypothetical protein LA080_011365 [Diaporthe eres]